MTSNDLFCINDYDCIGFDMDHTMVQYKLPNTFRLQYQCVVDFLVNEKSYCPKTFNMENYEKFEDFSQRGIIFDIVKGNFVKLDKNGVVVSCTHGMRECDAEETMSYYGEDRVWPLFQTLKEKVYNAEGYWIIENFFLMPVCSIMGQMVEEADKRNDGKHLSTYKPLYVHMIEALALSFDNKSFRKDIGGFFPAFKRNQEKYIKKIPQSVVDWIRSLRKAGKVVALITDSYTDFASHLMEYALGPDWTNDFDFIVTHANKPNFFTPSYKDRCFVNNDANGDESTEVKDTLKPHTIYSLGNAWKFEETLKAYTGKDEVKVVYFGDSMKSDVFPPKHLKGWDTVAVLEELEAEEVHFHKNNQSIYHQAKRPKIKPLLKEEKLLIASSQWGSFFTHPQSSHQDGTTSNGKQNGSTSNDEVHEINTFWGDIIRRYSDLAIPLLDYLAETSVTEKFPKFTDSQFGFFPSAPRSILKDHCLDEKNGKNE
eukprot:TCONS_00020068-protein